MCKSQIVGRQDNQGFFLKPLVHHLPVSPPQKKSRMFSVPQQRRVLCCNHIKKQIPLTVLIGPKAFRWLGWDHISRLFTLESEGLFDGERDAQQGEPVLQHLFPSSLLFYQLVHLRGLLEGSVEPDGERTKLPIRLNAALRSRQSDGCWQKVRLARLSTVKVRKKWQRKLFKSKICHSTLFQNGQILI